jgi:membrane peptidoglycan carboxypeptidase
LLGAIELTLPDLLNAYYRFLQEQCSLNPEFYAKTLDILSDPTQTTLKHSVNHKLSNFSFFGKTGTTNKSIDNLFIFFDGKLLGTIWVGIEGKRPDKSLHLGGSRTSFKIFQDFILNRGKRFNMLGCSVIR